MNTTNLFTDFEDFDEQSREILTAYQNDFLDLDYFEKQEKDPFEGIRTAKTFQEISNEIAMSTPFGDNSFLHSNYKDKQQRGRYIRDIFSLMDKNCISELYYTHNPKDSTNSGFLIYFNKNTKRIMFLFSKGQSDNEGQRYYYQTLEENCNLKVSINSGGNFIIKGQDSSSWKVVNSKYYHSFPYNLAYYKNKFSTNDINPSVEELKQIYEDLLYRKNAVMLCKNHVDFNNLIKKIHQQLAKKFYNNVNTSVYFKQVDANGKVLKEDFLKTNHQKPWDIKLNITLNPNGKVNIKHVAADVYLKKHEEKWKKEAKARGLAIDISALRKQVINDFESKSVENSFYQKFIQESQSLLDDSIVGYVEGIQVTQKIGKNVWEEGVINQSTWLTKNSEHTKWPEYARLHPLVGGVTDGVVDEIVGIPMAIKGVYEIVTDEKKQESLKKIFTKEGAFQMMEGLVKDAKETLNDQDKAQHFSGQTVVSVATMLSGAGFLTKAGKIDDVADLGADLNNTIPNTQTTKFLDKVKKTERHVETDKAVKELTEEVGGERLSEAVDELNDLTENAVKNGKKFTWQEIKAFFKRGNDFNEKVRLLDPPKYDFHEVTVEHIVDGKLKKYRLDSYNEGLEIVSRKATDFDNIKLSTFEGYLKELNKKYTEGSKITAPKYPYLKDKVLKGKLKLEVPESNKLSPKLKEFEELAKKYKIEIIFEKE